MKESEAWAELPDDVKKSHEDRLREATMYAKNRNVLALKTVHALELITKFITRLVWNNGMKGGREREREMINELCIYIMLSQTVHFSRHGG